VALSRVRKKLFFVADKQDFKEAARNSSWDCGLLAKDLLKLASVTNGDGMDSDEDSADSFDYRE
jgi:predicted exporter